MISRFIRVFFWAILIASVFSWVYAGIVSATAREAVIVLQRKRGLPDLVGPGESRFFPGRIVPGRVELHPVDIGPRMLAVEYQKGLYQSEMLGLDESFYVRVKFRLRYSLNPERLPDLFLKMEGLAWTSLDGYLRLRLNDILNRRMARMFPADNELPQLPRRLNDYFADEAVKEIQAAMTEDGVKIETIVIENVYVPDPARYAAILGGAQGILNQKLERIRRRDEALARRDAESLTDEATYARLETIGKLLLKYPGLKDYLAIDRLGEDVRVMVFPYEKWFSGQGIAEDLNLRPPANGNRNRNGNGRANFENLTPP